MGLAQLKHEVSAIDVSAVRTDGGTQPRAAIYQNVIDDYAEALAAGAAFPAVVAFYDGTDYWLADGFHRHAAHKKVGLAEIDADIRQGTRRDAVLYSVGANSSHGLRRTNEDKRRAVLTLIGDSEWKRWPQTDIAKYCGVSREYVNRLSSDLSCDRSHDAVREVERNGTTYTQNTTNIGRVAPIPVEVRETSEPAPLPVSVLQAPEPANDNDEAHNHRAQGTGENEWYTPSEYVERARAVLGTIDVDPASNPVAQVNVKAGVYYTVETNGLDKEWNGKVWMNPPYAQPAISHFSDKMVEEYTSGRCTEAVVLTHNYTDTGWFHKMEGAASAVCFTRGRIRFESPTGEKASPTQGQAFFYFGDNVHGFKEAFKGVGFIR